MDLMTLVTLAGLFVGVVVGNAALLGDSFYVSLAVPKTVAEAGLDSANAERLFAARVGWYARLDSVVPTPTVRVGSTPDMATALAAPLGMQGVVRAAQAQLRHDLVTADGAIMTQSGSKALMLDMVVRNPPYAPAAIELTQPDGDAKALIHTAAREAMLRIAPYRVALSDAADILSGDEAAADRTRKTALRVLNFQRRPSSDAQTEVALLNNLLAVLAIRDGDVAEARRRLGSVDTIPDADPAARGLASVNRAFLALTEKAPNDAERHLREGERLLGSVQPEWLSARVKVMDALVQWAKGRKTEAEALLREVIAVSSLQIEPRVYLAKLHAARGDAAGAAREMAVVPTLHMFDVPYPGMAHMIVALDPETGKIDKAAFVMDQAAASAPTAVAAAKPAADKPAGADKK